MPSATTARAEDQTAPKPKRDRTDEEKGRDTPGVTEGVVMTGAKICEIVPDLQRLAFPVERLTPLPGNPRQGDVQAVARSYATFGQRKPIVARHAMEEPGEQRDKDLQNQVTAIRAQMRAAQKARSRSGSSGRRSHPSPCASPRSTSPDSSAS